MFYKELYMELGKLFYYISGADGKVAPAEKETLQKFIIEKWKPLESSEDRFGSDRAYLIDFAFEFEEEKSASENYFGSFEIFYKQNKSNFTPEIKSNILLTTKAIAESYRGKNKKEEEVIKKLSHLFTE